MRRLFAFFVICGVLGSSLLVHSQMRGANEAMRYADVLAEYEPFQKLGLDVEKAWSALVPFYPLSAENGEKLSARKINHLVEIYLHSRELAPCGHKEEHETIGTPCSYSRGTDLWNLFVRVIQALHKQKAIDGRTLLYLLEQEPEGWAMEESHFIFNGKIIKSKVDITDDMVAAKRKILVKEGFQTAVHWSNEEIRRSLLRSERGVSFAEIDKEIGAARGDAARTFINFVIRPLYLVIHHKASTYEGSLEELPKFIGKNIGRSLKVAELQKLRKESPAIFVSAPKEKLASVETAVLDSTLPKVSIDEFKENKVVEPTVMAKAEVKTKPVIKAPVKQVAKPVVRRQAKPEANGGFARAYGGSRFGVTWGR